MAKPRKQRVTCLLEGPAVDGPIAGRRTRDHAGECVKALMRESATHARTSVKRMHVAARACRTAPRRPRTTSSSELRCSGRMATPPPPPLFLVSAALWSALMGDGRPRADRTLSGCPARRRNIHKYETEENVVLFRLACCAKTVCEKCTTKVITRTMTVRLHVSSCTVRSLAVAALCGPMKNPFGLCTLLCWSRSSKSEVQNRSRSKLSTPASISAAIVPSLAKPPASTPRCETIIGGVRAQPPDMELLGP
eukprot:3431482-Pleurochrysis_carterae.AAC.1